MSTLVSVDFDFLVYLPQDGRRLRLVGDGGREIRGSAQQLFDFGAGDSTVFAETLWSLRRDSFAQHGIELERVITLRPDEGIPTIPEFCAALSRSSHGLTDQNVPISVHDHHSEALRFLHERLEHVEHVVSFDAHHDLGYGPADAHRAQARRYTVGSWLYGALREELADRATVVYPDWRGLGEWQELSDDINRCEQLARVAGTSCHWLSDLQDRITITSWSEWLKRSGRRPLESTDGVFVCRSPGWTPPWCDHQFDELVDRLAAGRRLEGQRPTRRAGRCARQAPARTGPERAYGSTRTEHALGA